MNRDRESRHETGNGARGEQSRGGEMAERARGFFERASERMREAARSVMHRGRDRDDRSMRASGRDDDRTYGRYDTRTAHRDDPRGFGGYGGSQYEHRGHDRGGLYARGDRDDRGVRANLGGGYDMHDRSRDRGTVGDPMRSFGARDRHDRGGYGGYGGSQYMRDERDNIDDDDRWGRDDRRTRDRGW